jgi:hypothetical protein
VLSRLGEVSDSEPAQATESQGRKVNVPPALGCFSVFLVAVLAAGMLLIVLSIALRGEARFDKGDLGELRIWLIRETANQGLALSTTRIIAGAESSGEACVRTTARFLMVRSAQEIKDVAFCECYEKQGETWVGAGDCPTPNP